MVTHFPKYLRTRAQAVGWLGHPIFRDKEGGELFVRRMPRWIGYGIRIPDT